MTGHRGGVKKLPAEARQAKIRQRFGELPGVAISELAAEFAVSEMTIRRDLAVLEATYAHIRSAETKLKLDTVEPVEGIRRLVAFTWRYYLDNPHFLTLLNSENLHQGRHLKTSNRIAALHSPFVATIADLLERGERSGVIRRGIDPVQLYISIAALSYFYLSNNHTLSTIFVRDLLSPRAKSARLKHMTELIEAAVRP